MFKTIGVIGRVQKKGVGDTLEALLMYLKKRQQSFFVDADTVSQHPVTAPTLPRHQLGKQCDLIIVVGGDGSLLQASRDIIEDGTRVLGINRGSLGFLTDINPPALATQLDAILAGHYSEEKRFLLDVQLTHRENVIARTLALNEMVLLPNVNPKMTDFEVFIDQRFLCREKSDGIILATPTGSTAYALSGGGPIIHPEVDAIVIMPMFSHTLSSRPLIVDANHLITINILDSNTRTPRISGDGQDCIDVPIGSQLRVQKNKKYLHLIHPLDYDYYGTLRSKLHWGKRHYYEEA